MRRQVVDGGVGPAHALATEFDIGVGCAQALELERLVRQHAPGDLAAHGAALLLGGFRGRCPLAWRQPDKPTQVLVVEATRRQLRRERRPGLRQVCIEVACEVAVAYRAFELAEGPMTVAVRQFASQLVRWRPWDRQRNDRVELRQILSLKL